MKKFFGPLIIIVLIVVAGAGWWVFGRGHDPMIAARQLAAKNDLRGAQIELRSAVRADPKNAEAHFRLGSLDLQLGDPIAAEKEFRDARDDGYDASVVVPALAQAYLNQGKFKQVLTDFPAESVPAPQQPAILVLRSLAQLGLNDPQAAQASADEAEGLAPQLVDPVLASARVSVVQKNFPLAEQKVDRALTIDGHRADAMFMKAQLLNSRGDGPGAQAMLDAALKQSPHMTGALLERATRELAGGQDAKAKTDVDAAIKVEPRSAYAIYLQAVLAIRAKDFTSADVDLQRISTVLSRFPRGLYYLAVVKSSLGQAAQAEEAAIKYAARNPSDPQAVKLLAQIELAARKPEPAIDALKNAVSAGHGDAEMLDLLGRSYTMAGQANQAERSFQKAADLDPGNAEILTRLASARLGMGDAAGATGALERSLELSPAQSNAAEALVVAALAAGDTDRATSALDKLRQQAGDTEAVGNLAGMVKLARLDAPGAQEQFESVLRDHPDSVTTKMNLARVLAQQGKMSEAEKVLSDVLDKQPADATALSTMLAVLLQQGKIPRAIAVVEAAHAAAPTNPNLTAVLADLYVRANDSKKALAVLGPLEQGQPPALLGALARAQVAAGMPKEARDTYQKILAANPADQDARRRLVDLALSANDADGARAAILDGIKAKPGDQGMLDIAIAVAFKTGGLDAALAMADQLRKDPANLPGALTLKGDAYMAAGRPNDAAPAYAAELKAAPSPQLALRTATALNAAGKQDAAVQQLTAWLAQHPDDVDASLMLASLDIAAHRYADAKTRLQVALDKRPNNPAALNNLAWTYQQLGDPQARTVAQRAYLLAPSPETADTLGWIMTKGGDLPNGLALLKEAGAQRPNDKNIQVHLAEALNANGQKDEALKVLSPLVSAQGEFEEKANARRLMEQLSAKR